MTVIKKNILVLLLLILTIPTYADNIFNLGPINFDVYVNGEKYADDELPLLNFISEKGSNVYVPFRSIFEKANYIVKWDGENAYVESPKIVAMVGDSITKSGNWNNLINDKHYKFVNFGVGGNRVYDVLKRRNTISDLKPDICFIMLGTNNATNNIKTDTTYSRYIRLIEYIQNYGSKVIVQSTLYISREGYTDRNVLIEELNKRLVEYCIQNNIEFIDLNKHLSNNNRLLMDYSIDGIHLNDEGYNIWKDLIKQYLN